MYCFLYSYIHIIYLMYADRLIRCDSMSLESCSVQEHLSGCPIRPQPRGVTILWQETLQRQSSGQYVLRHHSKKFIQT